MENYGGCITLTNSARTVQLFKVDALAASLQKTDRALGWTRTSVGGYDWVIDYYPNWRSSGATGSKFCITLDSDASGVAASFACRLVNSPEKQPGTSQAATPVSATLSKGQVKDVFCWIIN
jgi:hypothetical protein